MNITYRCRQNVAICPQSDKKKSSSRMEEFHLPEWNTARSMVKRQQHPIWWWKSCSKKVLSCFIIEKEDQLLQESCCMLHLNEWYFSMKLMTCIPIWFKWLIAICVRYEDINSKSFHFLFKLRVTQISLTYGAVFPSRVKFIAFKFYWHLEAYVPPYDTKK